MQQKVLKPDNNYEELDEYLKYNQVKKLFLVCDSAISFLEINNYFEKVEKNLGIKVIRFNDFEPNPLYESVKKGIKIFLNENCDQIIAVGGGSAIDIAKCIKLYAHMDHSINYLTQKIVPNNIRLLAIPTTAGTGSEATKYAVIYYKGEKQSVSDDSCIPSAVLMDPSVLKTLPEYQKKSTMLDALCHAIESYWSINSNDISKNYAKEAIQMILNNKEGYLKNYTKENENMLKAANLAGKAINITQTTAGHAMCYRLTSLYGIAHGHAASLCVCKLWRYMVENTDKCIDGRGKKYLDKTFEEIANIMGYDSPQKAAEFFEEFVIGLNLEIPQIRDADEYNILRTSVNSVRLKNNPIYLNENAINDLYHQILK